jgi:hypothetical protein
MLESRGITLVSSETSPEQVLILPCIQTEEEMAEMARNPLFAT